MKFECLIRAFHVLETQRKRNRDLTGNRESISVIISIGRSDIMEETVVAVVSLEVSDYGLLFPDFNFISIQCECL